MRVIDRTSNATSTFSGQCGSRGYTNGVQGQFYNPNFVAIDHKDNNQLLIADKKNHAMRTLDVNSRALGTFAKSYSLLYRISYIIQEEKSGDFYVTARHAISRITYAQGAVSLISGAIRTRSYIDGTLPISRYSYPRELVFVAPHTLLVADRYNHKLRLVAMDSDQVTTLNVTNSLYKPQTLILTSNTLYVGYQKTILQRKCEYHSTYSFT